MERSLNRLVDDCAEQGVTPAAWHLVVPIDPNQAEEAWFARLTEGLPFPCDWLGLTWLNDKLAQRPDIPRFFLLGADQRAIELLKDLSAEQAAMANGVPDAIDRLRLLAARLDEVSPFYRFDIALRDGQPSVSAVPRYPGAEIDSPIRGNFTLAFPGDEAGDAARAAFEEAIAFGTGVEIAQEYVEGLSIEAPAGLGGDFKRAAIAIGAAVEQELDIQLRMRLVDPDARTLGELDLRFNRRTRGIRGVRLEGADASGVLGCTVQIDFENSAFTLTFEPAEPVGISPGVALPVLRFLRHYTAPNSIAIRSPQVPDADPLSPPMPVPSTEQLVPPMTIRIVEALDLLSRHANVQLTIPDELSKDEVREILACARLVRGEELAGTWSTMEAQIRTDRLEETLALLEPGGTLLVVREKTLRIRGIDLFLGAVEEELHSAHVTNADSA